MLERFTVRSEEGHTSLLKPVYVEFKSQGCVLENKIHFLMGHVCHTDECNFKLKFKMGAVKEADNSTFK